MSKRPMGGEEGHAVYIDETTYGVTPTNPSFLWIGIIQDIDPGIDPSLLRLRGCGSRYLQYLLDGLRKVDLRIAYLYQNKGFLNAIMQGLPTGSGQPLSIETYWVNPGGGALEVSMLHKGCLLNEVKVSGHVITGEDMEILVETSIIAQNVVVGSTHPTGASYPSDPGTIPKLGSDVKIEINSTELTDIYDFSFNIRNNLKRYPVIRATDGNLLKWLLGRGFEVNIEMVGYLTDTSYLAGLISDVEKDIKFTIGTDIYTFADCHYSGIREPTKVLSETPQRLSWSGKSLAIT